jgi:hypothetical protein
MAEIALLILLLIGLVIFVAMALEDLFHEWSEKTQGKGKHRDS